MEKEPHQGCACMQSLVSWGINQGLEKVLPGGQENHWKSDGK